MYLYAFVFLFLDGELMFTGALPAGILCDLGWIVTLQTGLVFTPTRGITGWGPLFMFISLAEVHCTIKGVHTGTRKLNWKQSQSPNLSGGEPGEQSGCLAGIG